VIAVAALLGAALCSLQAAPPAVAPHLGIAATTLSRIFIICFSLLGTGGLLLSLGYNEARNLKGEEYPATVLFAVFGMIAMASATNLLVLFLGLEAMTFAFYILVAMDLQRESSAEAGMKYLLPGALSAAFLAFGIALFYAATGSLGLALTSPGVPLSPLLSGCSKGAAILLLLLILPASGDVSFLDVPLRLLALFSMVVGNLAALLQTQVKRMLAYSSVGQMGYVVLALVGGGSDGYSGAGFYAVAYGVMSLASFGSLAVLEAPGSSGLLQEYRGAGRTRPLAAGVLALSLFALAGIPPTVGFTGKFLIFAAAIKGGEILLALAGILTAAISAYYYLRVVVVLFMHEHDGTDLPATSPVAAWILVAAAAAMLILGLFPSPLLEVFRSVFH